MITALSRDGTTEIIVYEHDRIVIALNRNGRCVARIFISHDDLFGACRDIRIPPQPRKGN